MIYSPLCHTSGRIDLFIPADIFTEYKQTVMGILDGPLVKKHFTCDNSYYFSYSGTSSEIQLIPLGSLMDSSVMRKLLLST